MSEQERQLKALLEMVKRQQLTLKKVSEQIDLSYRQIKRIYKRYCTKGDAGLIHRGRGRLANRQHSHKTLIIERYQQRYEGFGPTLAAEKLLEEGFKVDHETLRRWLSAKGIWSQKRQRLAYRQRRERRAQLGELIQIDGSIHDWFSEGKLTCLINMVDDATGRTLSRLEEGETTAGVFKLLWSWIERYGIPLALYVDLKSVYVSPKEGGSSHLEVACKKLGIRIIKAYSAQAKGRVERNHAVYQDRLVKELKLQNIVTLDRANQFLETGFVDGLNKRFEKPPRIAESAHRAIGSLDLNQILCWEYTRKLLNDWTFSFEGNYYQVRKTSCGLRPRIELYVRRHLNEEINAYYQDQRLEIELLSEKPSKITKVHNIHLPFQAARSQSEQHPWKSSWKRSQAIKFAKKAQLIDSGVDNSTRCVSNPDKKPEVPYRNRSPLRYFDFAMIMAINKSSSAIKE